MSATGQDAAVEPATATVSVASPVNDEVVNKRMHIFHWSAWQAGMWKGVGIALGIAGLLLIGLVATSIYRTTSIIDAKSGDDFAFIFSGLGLINNTLLRLLAMLIGAGIIFGGLAVSFFSSSDSNRISLQALPAAGESFKAMVATHTPGIVGIFMGGIIIIAALFARSTHNYTAPERIEITPGNAQPTEAQTNSPPPILLPMSSEVRKQYNSSSTKNQAGKPKNESD
ncbi:hypothetical protein BK654_26455 [Pseudomonas brassicacearum]|uniref:hypothetical protein n=1 Tax=Pseudomonas brassicacearum TaxID=930166 RepID=UPI000F46C2A1|nr:hypothetical protein [Pseudomonas brassicacearum]ROM72448.1 hypothetical protein BK654_26455 [Pseudomonas brassicacearum]